MASRQTKERELLELKRKRYLFRLKAVLEYKGPDPDQQEASLYWLARVCGYNADGPYRLIIRHQNRTAFGPRDADLTEGFRGLGKTSIGSIVRAIKYHIDDRNARGLVVSDTQGAAENILREIRTILQTNETLITLFGRAFGADRYSDLGRYRDSYATTLWRRDPTIKEPTFTALGTGGQAASMHFSFIIADDLVTMGNSRTKKQRQIVEDWHGSTLLGCGIEGTKRHYLGTRYYPNDLYQILECGRVDEPRGVLADATLKIPALVVGPDGQEATTFPQRFPTEFFVHKRRELGRYHFASQYQQDTSSADGMIFRYADFRWYGRADADEVHVPKGLGIFQFTDLPAKRTETGDFMATITIGVTPDTTAAKVQIFVLDLVHERCGMGKMRENAIAALNKWNPIEHGIEAVAFQAGFAQDLQETVDPRFKPCEVEADKVFRARRVSPLVENGQVYFPMPDSARGRAMAVLFDELGTFPDGDFDDCVDALVGAIDRAVFSGRPAAYGGDDGGPGDYDTGSGFRARY